MMANESRAQNFSLSELNKYIPSVEKLNIDISDDLVAEIKKEIENKILVSSRLRLNTDDSETFFQITIDRKEKRIIWNNTDNKFIFGRFLLYAKYLIDNTAPQQYNSLRQSVFCFGQVSADDTKSNGNIEYVNKLCNTAGISFSAQTPKESPISAITAITDTNNRAERIATPTKASDVLPKQKQQIKKKVETPVVTKPVTEISPSVSVNENASDTTSDDVTPVVGTPFLSYGFSFLLLKPSEADTRPARKAIIDGYLFENTVSFFFGPASSYKTFWLLWEAVHIATGKELCGMPIKGGARKILFVSLEMTAKDISDRLHKMTANWTAEEKQLLDENFYIISAEDESRIRATSKNILDALMALCTAYDISGIYLDAYTEYIVGIDVRSEAMGEVIDAMRMKANKHHVYFRVIHHSTKSTQTKEGTIDGTMAGIHTIRDTADQVYAMKLLNDSLEIRITNDQTKDSSAKPRFEKAITFTVKFISDDERGTFAFQRLSNNETSSYMEKLSNLLTVITENQGISSGDLKSKLGDSKEMREVLANAVHAGSIIIHSKQSKRGSPTKCHYTSDYFTENEEEIVKR